MKKILVVITLLFTTLILVGCGNPNNKPGDQSSDPIHSGFKTPFPLDFKTAQDFSKSTPLSDADAKAYVKTILDSENFKYLDYDLAPTLPNTHTYKFEIKLYALTHKTSKNTYTHLQGASTRDGMFNNKGQAYVNINDSLWNDYKVLDEKYRHHETHVVKQVIENKDIYTQDHTTFIDSKKTPNEVKNEFFNKSIKNRYPEVKLPPVESFKTLFNDPDLKVYKDGDDHIISFNNSNVREIVDNFLDFQIGVVEQYPHEPKIEGLIYNLRFNKENILTKIETSMNFKHHAEYEHSTVHDEKQIVYVCFELVNENITLPTIDKSKFTEFDLGDKISKLSDNWGK